jgi:lipopolysaccharide assembly outer membrane protein LptD (OstA)
METHSSELTAFDVVRIYEKHGMQISTDEAKNVLEFMDKMIKLVKKQLLENENCRFIHTSEHR